MKHSFFYLFISLALLPMAQEIEENSIDIECQICLKESDVFNTNAITECVNNATEKWKALTYQNYQELMELLNKEEKAQLINAQQQWEAFQEKENLFSRTIYDRMQGSMWMQIAATTNYELYKQRALELKGYIVSLTSD